MQNVLGKIKKILNENSFDERPNLFDKLYTMYKYIYYFIAV